MGLTFKVDELGAMMKILKDTNVDPEDLCKVLEIFDQKRIEIMDGSDTPECDWGKALNDCLTDMKGIGKV